MPYAVVHVHVQSTMSVNVNTAGTCIGIDAVPCGRIDVHCGLASSFEGDDPNITYIHTS